MKTSWKKLINPDYLGAYSLLNDNGDYIEKTYTIKSARQEEVKGPEGKEMCIVLQFVEEQKPMVLNATNAKVITKLYKSQFVEDWSNCRITLYVKNVSAFGDKVDALRIKETIPEIKQSNTYKCADCDKTIQPLGEKTAQYMASYTNKKYGKPLCAECATKRAEQEKADKPADPLAKFEQNDEPREIVSAPDNTEDFKFI